MTSASALRRQAAGFGGLEGFDPDAELALAARKGVRLLAKGGPAYPELLASCPDAPELLYLRGALPERPGIAVVGSRRPTPYGRRMARLLAGEAARAGLVVVSGLARGVDTEAHEAALEAGGLTWAVLGSGLERVYPPENRGLAARIAASGGAVLSEVPLEGPPLGPNFPRRNRIISGLSWATVVVEGDLKSGALITAKAALAQGREVLAVPGPVGSPMSEGPLALLRDGAAPAACLRDVLDRLPPSVRALSLERPSSAPAAASGSSPYKQEASPKPPARGRGFPYSDGGTGGPKKNILESMGWEAVSLEELLRSTGLELPALLRWIAELEIEGLVDALPGQRYARR